MNKTKANDWIFVIIRILILMILQTTANEYIRMNNFIPDLFFAFAVFFACSGKSFYFIVTVAFISGIISDFVCNSSFIGYTAIYTYSAAVAYYFKNLFIKPNVVFLSIIAFVIFIVGKTVLYPVFLVNSGADFGTYMISDVIPGAFYNTICFSVMRIVSRVIKRIGGRKDATDI